MRDVGSVNSKWSFEAKKTFVTFGVLILSFILSLQSNSNIFVYREQGVDSSVFQYVAKMMLDGYMPYRDTFDHKGPVLYFINCLGLIINEKWGIWLVEWAFLSVTLASLYRLFRIRCSSAISFLLVIMSFSMFGYYIYGGNFCEEYALPFITISLYIFLDYFENANINRFRLAVCGFSLGAVLLLRPNMAAIWPVMCIGVLIVCIMNKKMHELPKFILWFLAGLLIIFVPVIAWLSCKGILRDCYDAYVVFNMMYSNGDMGDKFIAYGKFQSYFPVAISLGICFEEALRKKSIKAIGYMALIFFSLVMASLSGATYKHYELVNSTVVMYPVAVLFSELNYYVKNKKILLLLATSVIGAVLLFNTSTVGVFTNAAYCITHSGEVYFPQEYRDIVQLVDEVTDKEDRVVFFGNMNRYYLLTDRYSASRFSYQTPIFMYGESLGWPYEFFTELDEDPPKIIGVLTEKAWVYDREIMYAFLDFYDYDLAIETDDVSIYILPGLIK